MLLPEDIVDEPEPQHEHEREQTSTLSSAAPMATTAALAASVAKEGGKAVQTRSTDSLPGAFPETPAAETPGSEPQTFNINPIPASSGLGNPIKLAPGEPVPESSSFNDKTVSSTVKHDDEPEEEASTFGVAPLPATAGAGNPIHLAPGEKVPDSSTFTSNTVDSTAKTDEGSYNKSDALPELAFTPQAEREAKGGMFALPPVMGNMIPESSLPMGVDAKIEQDTGVTIQSSAPHSTTAALAGQVPKEPRGVPEIVSESQHEAGAPAEASANPEAVQEKRELEQELKEKVPEAPAAADNSYASQISSGANQAASNAYAALPSAETVKSNTNAAAATAAAGVTAGAGLFASAIYSAKDKAAETVGYTTAAAGDIKDKAVETVGYTTTAAGDIEGKAASAVGLNGSATADDVPAVVSESQREAHVAPEASSNAEAVREKSAFEQELLAEVPKTNEHGEPAPAIAVPSVVADSQREAQASPEAAANSEAVAEKHALESELLSKLPKTDETGEPAPSHSFGTTGAALGGAAAFGGAALGGAALASHYHSDSPTLDVPEVVTESQKEAHVGPEAAANPEAVSEKKDVESELLREIPKTNEAGEPAPVLTAETSATAPGLYTGAAFGGAAIGGAALGGLGGAALASHSNSVARDVPDVVAESQYQAHASPEASANYEAVSEKKAVESELLKEVKTTDATGEPAPSAGAFTGSSAAAVTGTHASGGLSDDALVSPKPLSSSSEPDGLNAPASAPAKPANVKPIDSSTNVTFAQKEPTTTQQTQPTVTTGVETTTTAATSSGLAAPETPKKDARKDSDVSPKGTPGSQSVASGTDDKKKKRRSIFGKIKDKLSSKH